MEEVEKVTVSVAVVLFDMKMHSSSVSKKFYRSRSFGDLGQRSLVICQSTFSKDFSSETTNLISIKFHMQSLDRGGKESLYISSRSRDQDGRYAYIW